MEVDALRTAKDYPLAELEVMCKQVCEQGGKFWMKFTCSNCGARQICAEEHKLFYEASCEECGSITNLREQGGGLLVMLVTKKP